jgi:putative ABC transport system substrate-binding protein
LAAKAATASIPIVFVAGGDPVQLGIVSSLAHPGANITGINILTTLLENKRFGLLREAIPKVQKFAALVNPNRAVVQGQIAEVKDAAARSGVDVVIVNASTESEFEPAFSRLVEQGAGAVQVCADPFFFTQRHDLVALAARYRVPAIYEWREFADAGGLMSYGTDLADSYRQAGLYVARILDGAKPSDLPVMQTTRFEFVINLRTAKALGLEVPPTLSARADEVIE